MENRNSICRWLPLVCTMLVLLTVLLPAKVSAATGVNVDIHTQAEIKAYYERIEANSSFDVTYEQEQSLQGRITTQANCRSPPCRAQWTCSTLCVTLQVFPMMCS